MNNQQEQQLEQLDKLERVIAKGLVAYEERNALIVSLIQNGVKQAEVARRINRVRQHTGAPTITPDAVAATMRRVSKPQNAGQDSGKPV